MNRLLILLLALTGPLLAFDANSSWPSGKTSFNLLLDTGTTKKALPSGGLTDGKANWEAVAREALQIWNQQLVRTQLEFITSSGSPGDGNGTNEIAFSDKAYDEDFGERTLAITFIRFSSRYSNVRLSETDILVNTSFTWDSYRGNLRSAIDLRRVLMHEMGHAIGLSHPDEASPAQTVTALMNSKVSNVETVASDDIEGAKILYGTTIVVPTLTRQPSGGVVKETDAADIYIETNGTTAPDSSPTLAYSWQFTPSATGTTEYLFGQPQARIPLGAVQSSDAGSYRVRIETPDGDVNSGSTSLNVTAVARDSATRLYNLSTRGYVGAGDQSLIVGFSIQTATKRKLLIRGVGPGLAQFIGNTYVPDPELIVRRFSDQAEVGRSDNWSAEAPGLSATFSTAGAFALATGSTDAAVLVELEAGNYTAVMSPRGTTSTGIGLVEVYDLSSTSSPTERLFNLSTRGYVDGGDRILIAGFSVTGSGPGRYLLRAAGDTLQQMNVSGTLDDPVTTLFDNTGRKLRYADDWDNPSSLQPTLREVMAKVGAFAFTDRQESALLLKLKPANYTLHVSGLNGGKGVALVELYDVDD